MLEISNLGMHERKAGVNAVNRLSRSVGKALGDTAIQKYFGSNLKVKHEYNLYQMEKIPECFSKRKDVSSTSNSYQQHSYWVQAYDMVDVEMYH